MHSTIFWAALGGVMLAGAVHAIGENNATGAALQMAAACVELFLCAPYWYRRSKGGSDA